MYKFWDVLLKVIITKNVLINVRFLPVTHMYCTQIDVHQKPTLRSYMRRHDMSVPPKKELAPHVQRRHKRRSTASHFDEKLEEQEMTLLKAGILPEWLQIDRIINKR